MDFRPVIIAACLLSAGTALAEPSAAGRQQGQGARIEAAGVRELISLKGELNLSDEQVLSMHQIRSDALREAQQKLAEARELRTAAGALLTQETPDFAAARAKLSGAGDKQREAQLILLDAHEKAWRVLSLGQRAKLAELRKRANPAQSRPRGHEAAMPGTAASGSSRPMPSEEIDSLFSSDK